MSEISKLYENCGIEIPIARLKIFKDDNGEIYTQPPFTAEKQIELIKWLAIRFNSDHMAYWHNEIIDAWIFQLYDLTGVSSEEPYIYEGRKKDFTEALCNLINDLWQDLTPEEKQQVKGILE